MLDGKEVTDTAKQFLCNWHATRETQKKKCEEFTRQGSFTGTDQNASHNTFC